MRDGNKASFVQHCGHVTCPDCTKTATMTVRSNFIDDIWDGVSIEIASVCDCRCKKKELIDDLLRTYIRLVQITTRGAK